MIAANARGAAGADVRRGRSAGWVWAVWLHGVAALVAGLAALAGCGDAGGDPSGRADGAGTGSAAPEAFEATGPVTSDRGAMRDAQGSAGVDETLVVALRRLPSTLDPVAELDPWGQRIVDDLVFEGLTVRAGDVAPFVEPAIADTCLLHPTAAPTHVYCHLRADLRFHDGQPVRSDDVIASLEHWTDARRGGLRQRHGLAGLRKVELTARPGPAGAGTKEEPGRWVHLEFDAPEPLALERIAAMKIVPKAKRRGAGFGRAPIGTGPMRVKSFAAEAIELERSEHARRRAGVPGLKLELVTDGAAALVRMRRGDLHVLAEVAPSHVPRELGKPGMAPRFTAWTLSPPRFDLVFYNLRSGPQARHDVRVALDRALPREALASALDPMPAQSAAVPVDLAAPIEIDLAALHEAKAAADWGTFGLPPRQSATRDADELAAAARALDGLGWRIDRGLRRRGDNTLRIVLMWDQHPGASTIVANGLKKAWRELGVQVPQVTASFAYLLGLMQRGDYDVALGRLATTSDADLFPYFHSRGSMNVPGVADADLDAALVEFRAATTGAERQAAKRRIAERLRALVPVSVVHAPLEIMLVSRRVLGLEFVDDVPRLDRIALGPASAWADDAGAP